uniref:Aminopyrrolnitrin oxidase PrnD-like Rieske oxygenase n=1 Tax=Westiella intricata UH HT-29-1 TaxID=1524912 RepID=A0A075X5T8_9CYAN|nr:aminopyrrolnitrin oxidase PrnD-like Rieske oxygenase [Westiella intricata UH HT-29-1]
MVSYIEKSVNLVKEPETQIKQSMNLAASWYIAMQSVELGKKPIAIELFGRALVAWRDKDRKAVIMERFCSHVGASLAIGEVVDGCIQCPFHHWRYDSSGVCVHIPKVATPHTDHIPSTARQKTYVTEERYGYIWVWYGTATPLFELPGFDAAESNKHKYMPYRFSFLVKTSVRRVVENAFDHHHFVTVHNVPVADSIDLTLVNHKDTELSELPIAKEAWFGTVIEARIKTLTGVGAAIAKFLGLNIETQKNRVDAWPTGYINIFSCDGQQRGKVLFGVTPISKNETRLQVLIMFNKMGNLLLDLFSYIVFVKQFKANGLLDKPIFDTMSTDTTGGAFIRSDQPLLKFRQFYQSWVAKAQ